MIDEMRESRDWWRARALELGERCAWWEKRYDALQARATTEENRAVGLRPMTITPQAADELRGLLADDTPGHQGAPVPTRDTPPAAPGEEDRCHATGNAG